MIVDGLRVRGKLNLLLLLPLTAVVLVAVPFVIGQIGNARSATATADSARNARQLGVLIWELQRERLVTADFLAEPAADDTAMLLQQQAARGRAGTCGPPRRRGPNCSPGGSWNRPTRTRPRGWCWSTRVRPRTAWTRWPSTCPTPPTRPPCRRSSAVPGPRPRRRPACAG